MKSGMGTSRDAKVPRACSSNTGRLEDRCLDTQPSQNTEPLVLPKPPGC